MLFLKSKIFTFLTALLVSILAVASGENEQDQQATETYLGQQSAKHTSSPKYNIPFLLLMSSKEISVMQLPLIDDGSITVVHRLSDRVDPNFNAIQESDIKKDADEGEQEEDGTAKVTPANADAREYEQQMPSPASLGKFGLNQQTATAGPGSATILAREEAATRTTADKPEGSVQEAKQPRRRRSDSSNNLDDYHHGNNRRSTRGSGNGIMRGNNNSSSNAYAVMESSSFNVTSAQFSTRTREGEKEVAPEEGGDDDKNGASFSDFDVHMAFGYVFASDSTGQIHRFRLSGFDDSEGNSNENLLANDYTNTIDAASKAPERRPEEESSVNTTVSDISNSNHESGIHYVDGNAITDDVADDANKVNPRNVAQRQSGRHPLPSGLAKSGSMKNGMVVDERGTPISDALKSGNNYSNQGKTAERRRFDESKPRIIWSRTKHGSPFSAHSARQPLPYSSAHQSDVESAAGAYPQQVSNQRSGGLVENYGGGNTLNSDNQTYSSAEQQMEGGNEQQSNSNHRDVQGGIGESAQTSAANSPANGLGQKRRVNRKLQTKIAVDWLNNLLFVLDKYRLFVVDFDGNNELVLIDDFDMNNRPVDIKVDPIHRFLFWLQVGKFHNTIYRLDLDILSEERVGNALKLISQARNKGKFGEKQVNSASQQLSLISHYDAQPIINNLPQKVRLFTIDHKHSRIYVPFAPAINDGGNGRNTTQRDDAEVFSADSSAITHMNNTYNQLNLEQPASTSIESEDKNCNSSETISNTSGQILGYNLDGTDAGPLRNETEKSHLFGMDDMQDITLDCEGGNLYWITNEGLFEEYRPESNSSFFLAQHTLDGKKYTKIKHFNNFSNQPTDKGQRTLLLLSTANRLIRSHTSDIRVASSLEGRYHKTGGSSFTLLSNPLGILAITCSAVLGVYILYAFVFQKISSSSINNDLSRDNSDIGSSIGESTDGSGLGAHGYLGTSTISRWIPNPSSRGTDNSGTHREYGSGNEHFDSCDTPSYNARNAIDEHYRDVNQALLNLETGPLADLQRWPSNMHDVSNKLYVPVEVLQDEALSSIQRISIDQLEIERGRPLGEGNFGKVLQGTITCKINDKSLIAHSEKLHDQCTTQNTSSYASALTAAQQRRMQVLSATSSGHGSSSTSSDFITAISCTEPTNCDYLTPKSHCTSTVSDYLIDNVSSSRPESCNSYNQEENISIVTIETKFKVAIKKLKEDASIEEKRDFLQEAKLLAKFDHPNIVQLIGICLDRGSTLIVMELMLGGDLIRYMQENTPPTSYQDNLTYDDLLQICLDIVNGCCYLEELNHIHRDLAARNCLVSSQLREERKVKLADFGLARDIYKDSYYKKITDSAMPLKWMAPECFLEQKFTIKSDVWSFGVVMWEVMSYCHEKPYKDVDVMFIKEYLASGNRLRKPSNCSDDVYSLMKECWQLYPEKRPTFQECRAVLIEIKNGTTIV